MKRICLILAIVVSGIALMPGSVSAQGPAGAGAGAAAASSSKSDSASHSYNPIKWIKKDAKKAESSDQIDDQQRKLTARLQGQGIVPDNADIKGLCTDFRELGECLAALHASHNLGLNFACVKSNVTGVRVGVDTSSCRMPNGDKPLNLSKTLKLLKPDSDAKGAAKDAEELAKTDLKETAS